MGIGRALGEAGDAGQDFVSAFGPHKGLCIGIVRVKKLLDGALTCALPELPPAPVWYLKLVENLSGFRTKLRERAQTLAVKERQQFLRLLAKEILVGSDTLTLRHSIPIAPSDGPPPNVPGSIPSGQPGYPLRPRRVHPRASETKHLSLGDILAVGVGPMQRNFGLMRKQFDLKVFLAEAGSLGKKLGPILFQLPPSLKFEARRAEKFFKLVRELYRREVVCEPRHPGWFTDEADQLLRKYQVARGIADPARVPDGSQLGGWPKLVYFRLHGSPKIYFSAYNVTFLQRLALRIERLARSAHVWCIFDNTAAGAAIGNALDLQTALSASRLFR